MPGDKFNVVMHFENPWNKRTNLSVGVECDPLNCLKGSIRLADVRMILILLRPCISRCDYNDIALRCQ